MKASPPALHPSVSLVDPRRISQFDVLVAAEHQTRPEQVPPASSGAPAAAGSPAAGRASPQAPPHAQAAHIGLSAAGKTGIGGPGWGAAGSGRRGASAPAPGSGTDLGKAGQGKLGLEEHDRGGAVRRPALRLVDAPGRPPSSPDRWPARRRLGREQDKSADSHATQEGRDLALGHARPRARHPLRRRGRCGSRRRAAASGRRAPARVHARGRPPSRRYGGDELADGVHAVGAAAEFRASHGS